jgi:hypothetical protein
MLNILMNSLFGCGHKHTSFPITPRSKNLRTKFETYVVCLDCGKELPYSWEEMRIVLGSASGAPAMGQQVGSFSVTK